MKINFNGAIQEWPDGQPLPAGAVAVVDAVITINQLMRDKKARAWYAPTGTTASFEANFIPKTLRVIERTNKYADGTEGKAMYLVVDDETFKCSKAIELALTGHNLNKVTVVPNSVNLTKWVPTAIGASKGMTYDSWRADFDFDIAD